MNLKFYLASSYGSLLGPKSLSQSDGSMILHHCGLEYGSLLSLCCVDFLVCKKIYMVQLIKALLLAIFGGGLSHSWRWPFERWWFQFAICILSLNFPFQFVIRIRVWIASLKLSNNFETLCKLSSISIFQFNHNKFDFNHFAKPSCRAQFGSSAQ